MIFLTKPGKDDQDHGVGWSSLTIPNEGPGAKSQKKSILRISKAEFGLIKDIAINSTPNVDIYRYSQSK